MDTPKNLWIFGAGVLLVMLASGFGASGFSTKPNKGIKIQGDRDGNVSVVDETTNRSEKTFVMDRGVVVREAGSLDGGKTVFASQKDHAVFWDVETGLEKARFGERIYLFSHDEKRFATFSRTPRNEIRIYAYPSMVLQLNLEGAEGKGPSALEFSPDDQYLLVQFNNYYPLSDDNYPIPEMSKSVYAIRLYDLGSGRVIEEFERGNPVVRIVGVFSEDSRYYYVRDVGAGNRLEVNDSRRFDLSSLKWFGTE